MQELISRIRNEFQTDLKELKDSRDVERLKVKYLGKKGLLQNLMEQLRHAPAEKRPLLGKEINALKEELTEHCEKALVSFSESELAQQLLEEKIDTSLPGRAPLLGKEHPITIVMQRVIDILIGMGFSVQYGPDLDTDYYNYEGLNFPPDHPAREMQDTFYVTPELLLRSHTSNTQLRVMENSSLPIRIITPGTVYRNETISSRSHVFFHQLEGLYIDKDVSFADLLATLQQFLDQLFGRRVKTLFRPSFFPFVEPGLEVDIACFSCQSQGCRLCKQTGWLEICGAGMVHPNVLQNGGINPEEYSGYAWGLGIERLTMLLYGIDDIRQFTENDMRFLDSVQSAAPMHVPTDKT